MVSPIDEKSESRGRVSRFERSSDDDHTVVGDGSVPNHSPTRGRADDHLTLTTNHLAPAPTSRSMQSPSQTREQAHRLDDDLAMLQVERQVSRELSEEDERNVSRSRSHHKSRTRREEPVDDFDINTNPAHLQAKAYKPPENPTTSLAKLFKKIHGSSFLIRYFFYITPVVLIILIPLLLGALLFKEASVGGVKLIWFCIWLEIVWLTLWAGRVGLPSIASIHHYLY